jgi:hypothetical protein
MEADDNSIRLELYTIIMGGGKTTLLSIAFNINNPGTRYSNFPSSSNMCYFSRRWYIIQYYKIIVEKIILYRPFIQKLMPRFQK